MTTAETLRWQMVDEQIVSRGVDQPNLIDAMRQVPRERFVPAKHRLHAYADAALPIADGQTISQPYVVALMIEALKLDNSAEVLEIGTGSGYAAAVLSRMVAQVDTVERIATLADTARQRLMALGYDNVRVHVADGTLGWETNAPYDGILVSAGGPHVPQPLLDQLAIGGRLLIPVGDDPGKQYLICVERKGEREFVRTDLGKVKFVPLIGKQGWEAE